MNIRKTLLLTLPATLLAGCMLTPPSEDPVLIKLDELDRRLQAIERVVENQSLVQLNQQVAALERRADELQGIAETIAYDASTTADRQRQLYLDLDQRIQQLEASLQAMSRPDNVLDGGNLAPGQLPIPGGSDSVNYRAAFELIKEQRYEDAAIAFRQFLQEFPDSDNAPNAQYWLAESHYVRQEFGEALAAFRRVIDNYPGSTKVADALLKTGFCNYELKRWDDARAALNRVQQDFPDTTAAALAVKRLERMATEGV